MAKKKIAKKESAKKESPRKQKRVEVVQYDRIPAGDDGRGARVAQGRQEQIDEIHSLMSQLDPSLKRPIVGGGKGKESTGKTVKGKDGKFVSRRK